MNLIVLTEQQIREIAEAAAIAAVVRMREDEPTPPRLMTRAELREYLRCSESTLARRIAEGMPSRGGRLFDKEEVDEWLRMKNTSHGRGTNTLLVQKRLRATGGTGHEFGTAGSG